MNTTPSPAIEAVELPPLPKAAWPMGTSFMPEGCAPDDAFDVDQMEKYAKSYGVALLAAKQEEVDKMTEHLQFVERWANHHGQRPHTTPQEALSVIQHYPPILAITRSYADGKVPETPNPYAELDKMRGAATKAADVFAGTPWRNWKIDKAVKELRAALSPTQGAAQ